MNTASRPLNSTSLNTRSARVTTAQRAGYTAWMRLLGLALVTVVAVVVLSANAEPVAPTKADIAVPAHMPHWDGVYAKAFPGCTDKGQFIPARIVVVPREGAAHTMRYNDATVAHIDATWNNDNPADDLYTIGKCAR